MVAWSENMLFASSNCLGFFLKHLAQNNGEPIHHRGQQEPRHEPKSCKTNDIAG